MGLMATQNSYCLYSCWVWIEAAATQQHGCLLFQPLCDSRVAVAVSVFSEVEPRLHSTPLEKSFLSKTRRRDMRFAIFGAEAVAVVRFLVFWV